MKQLKTDDLVIGVGLLFLAGFFYYLSYHVTGSRLADPVGPAGLPTVLSVTLSFLSIILIIQSIISTERSARPERLGFAVLGSILLLSYFVALPRVGFILSTPLFAIAMMLSFGCRRPLPLLATPILSTAAIYGVFRHLLLVPLP